MSVKEQYWKYSLITIILGLGLILFIKMSPFMGGILGACTIYIMVRKQMFYLTQEKHFKKSITAILLLIEAIMCFLVPLSLAVWLLINKLQTVNVDTTGFIHTVTNLADWLHTKTGYWRNGGSFLLYGVDEVLLHITRMNALSFWKER